MPKHVLGQMGITAGVVVHEPQNSRRASPALPQNNYPNQVFGVYLINRYPYHVEKTIIAFLALNTILPAAFAQSSVKWYSIVGAGFGYNSGRRVAP